MKTLIPQRVAFKEVEHVFPGELVGLEGSKAALPLMDRGEGAEQLQVRQTQ